MSLHAAPSPPTIVRLGPKDFPETVALLDADPVLNVYLCALALRDALARPRDEWWGSRRAGRLTAVLYRGGLSGAVLPAGDDPEGLRALGAIAARRDALPPRFQVIGAGKVSFKTQRAAGTESAGEFTSGLTGDTAGQSFFRGDHHRFYELTVF